MTQDGLCYLYKGASLTFQEAEEYCEVTMFFLTILFHAFFIKQLTNSFPDIVGVKGKK